MSKNAFCGTLDAAEVAHELRGRLRDERARLAELLRVDDAVIRLVRRGEAGELVCMRIPVEVAGVDNGAAHRRAMAVHVLRGGVRHDVRTPLDGTAKHGRGERVVHDERHAVGVSGGGEALDVEDVESGVRDGLAEDGLRVGAERRLKLFVRAIGCDERGLDTHALERVREQIERAAVDGRARDHMVTAAGDVEDGEEVRRLA